MQGEGSVDNVGAAQVAAVGDGNAMAASVGKCCCCDSPDLIPVPVLL